MLFVKALIGDDALAVGHGEGNTVVSASDTFIHVITSSTTLSSVDALAFTVLTPASALGIIGGKDAVSSSIAYIVIVIKTFTSVGEDTTVLIIIVVPSDASTAGSTAAHCELGNATDSFYIVGLGFIRADRS